MSGSTGSIQGITTETIGDIQNLQDAESQLFNALETGIANGSLTQAQQTQIITQINNISNMRIALYNNVNNLYNFQQNSVSSTEGVIADQLNAILIVENELNESKKQMAGLEEDKHNKLRLVEINKYYSDKYSTNIEIMQYVVLFCIINVILSVLVNKGILTRPIYAFLVVLIAVIFIIFIAYKISDANYRDNMVYDDYNWGPPPTGMYDTGGATGINPWTTPNICIGQDCCQTGYTYVESPDNKCVFNDLLPAGVQPYTP